MVMPPIFTPDDRINDVYLHMLQIVQFVLMLGVGIEVVDAAMDIEKLEAWLRKLLSTRGEDIFRSKGILNVSGTDERYVFQGVHMMMEMSSSAEGEFEGWGKDAKRVSRVIFIGRNLDRDDLESGFKACIA